MGKRGTPTLQEDFLQGTLDVLILRTLVLGPAHGHTIASVIEHSSEDVLRVEHGSLYPALHRLEEEGWIEAEWGASEANRQAKFYELTRAGRKQLTAEEENWQRIADAVARVLSQA
jgi:transcriptional regulator